MTEQTPNGGAVKAIANNPASFEIAEAQAAHKENGNGGAIPLPPPELGKEDFTDPNHPLYGTRDEFGRELPGWFEAITVRSLVLSAALGFVFNLMVMKLGFTVGIIPSLNIAAGLVGFTGIKGWVALMQGLRIKALQTPFSRQENTVIQTTVVAAYGLAFSGGFTNSVLAMDWNSYLRAEGADIQYPNATVPDSAYGKNPPTPLPANVVQPSFGKLVGFMATIYIVGVFVLVPLRRLFILKYRLTYPSGSATGLIINGFHTPLGEAAAKQQIKKLGKWFGISFLYSGLKWCFSGDSSCGMDQLPRFGLNARFWTWYSPFSATYIAIGLLIAKHITYGIMFGAVLAYGIMWPLIDEHKAGDWYPAAYKHPSNNIKGIYAYKVFLALGFILGDGAWNLFKLTFTTVWDLYKRRSIQDDGPLSAETFAEMTEEQRYQRRLRDLRDHVFLKGQMPWKLALGGYVGLAAISIGVAGKLFPGTHWYYVLIAYILAPVFGFCNAYGAGLSDWSLLTTYGKLCILIFAAWGGEEGGIIAGLCVCTIMQTIVGMCADLMQDFKTGHYTLASPRSMVAAQLIGACMAVVITPAAFWLYWSGFDVGKPGGEYPAPFAPVFRNIAVVAVRGSKELPKNTMALFGGAFAAAIVADAAREYLAWKIKPDSIWVKLIPIPSMVGIPAFIGGYFCVDMTIGAVILGIWQYFAPADALISAPLVASALIAGDGVWSVPSAILALAKVSPPMCAQFFRRTYFEDKVADLLEPK